MNFLKQLSSPNYASHIALLTENTSLTYQELNQLSDYCAAIFLNNDIKKNSVILLCFKNQCLQFIASIAALKIGACHLSLQPGGSIDKKRQIAQQAAIQNIVSDFDLPIGLDILSISLEQLKTSPKYIHETRSEIKNKSIDENTLAIIVPGSGTTGKSKLIGINYKNLNKLIERDLTARPIKAKEHHLSFTPIEFYTAKRRNFSCLQAGGCVIIRENFNSNLFTFFEKYSIEHISLASSHAKDILQINPNLTKSIFAHTKTLFLGGSPISEKLRTEIKKNITNNLFIAYGTNEVGECCIANAQLQSEFENCVGIPLKGVELEIVDENKNILEKNTVGELRIKADGMYSLYINYNDNNDQLAQQWFYPGDYALINEKDVLILKGRSDDAITFHGTMIYPREIEQHLEAIKEVGEVAAFGLNQADNQIPAVVFTASRPLNIKNVENYLKNKLGWLSPQFIRQIDKMPKNDAGKILKREIKQQIINELLKQKTNIAE